MYRTNTSQGRLLKLCLLTGLVLEPTRALSLATQPTPMTLSVFAQQEADRFAAQLAQLKAVSRTPIVPNELLSIHGVVPELQATLLLEGETLLLPRGARQRLAKSRRWVHLRRIRPPCVSLTLGGQQQTLCLQGGR